jgi:hypothetical protein
MSPRYALKKSVTEHIARMPCGKAVLSIPVD